MDSPIAAAKSAINVGFVIKLLVGLILVNLLLQVLGIWSWIYNPATAIKEKFGVNLPNA